MAEPTNSSDSNNVSASTAVLGVHHHAHPARELITLVEVLFLLYMIMLGYLNWGPTIDKSPRDTHTELFWGSIGMLLYSAIAVLVLLKMHKIGGVWTWWATLVGYSIYFIALMGFGVLIVLLSFN